MNNFGINVLECYFITFSGSASGTGNNSFFLNSSGHSHSFYQLSYALDEGDSELEIDHTPHPVRKNSLYIMRPNIIHTFNIKEVSNFIELKFYLTNPELEEILAMVPSVIFDDKMFIFNLLHTIHDEFKKSANDSLMFLKVYELLVMLKRLSFKHHDTKVIPNYSTSTESDKSRFSPLLDYIQGHYMENISRDNMARIMCMEPAYFSKKFKQVFGITPSDYVNNVRLSYAQNMLEYTSLAAFQISERLGFKSQNSFSRLFKAKHGITPLEYRKRLQQSIKEKYI